MGISKGSLQHARMELLNDRAKETTYGVEKLEDLQMSVSGFIRLGGWGEIT